MAQTERAWTVEQLNNYAKAVIEGDARLRRVHVSGELTGVKTYGRMGMTYFSLKDAAAVVSCVMYQSVRARLRFEPEDGMKVTATGDVSLFVRDGRFQLIVNSLKQEGEGEQYAELLELKKKLEAEGVFENCRPLPSLPKCIGVVTSGEGKALEDILSTVRTRFPGMRAVFVPSAVQGPNAPASIAGAIEYLNRIAVTDVIIVGRGGGSSEELSCYNDERVARAIHASRIPVVSAVGHELDYTLADFAADHRAGTPTLAAVMAVPIKAQLEDRILSLRAGLDQAVAARLGAERKRIDMLDSSAALSKPAALIAEKRMKLDRVLDALGYAVKNALEKRRAALEKLSEKLAALDPYAVLDRGYAIVSDGAGRPVIDASAAEIGSRLTVRMRGGRLGVVVETKETNDNR